MKNSIQTVQNIIHETIDLFTCHVDVFFSKNKSMLIFETGEELSIIVSEEHYSQVGIHRRGLEDLDEYGMSDLIERALRDGFPAIYIHPTKAA